MEKLLHKPDEGDYAVNFNPNEILELYTPGGENRTRRDLIDPAHTVTLTFTCEHLKYAEIVKFVGDYVGRNCEPFLIDLQLYASAYTEETVILVPNSFRLVSHNALQYVLSMEVEVATAGDPYTDGSVYVDLNAVTNAGPLPSVGVTVSGLNPLDYYEITLPLGLTFTGWSAWPSDDSTGPGHPLGPGFMWGNGFLVQGSLPVGVGNWTFGSSDGYADGETARAAFGSQMINGFSQYIFWISDINPADNRGGVSIRIRKL